MLVVQNDNGFALVEMLGREGEIPINVNVAADWDAVASATMYFGDQEFDVYMQGNMSLSEAVRLARQAAG